MSFSVDADSSVQLELLVVKSRINPALLPVPSFSMSNARSSTAFVFGSVVWLGARVRFNRLLFIGQLNGGSLLQRGSNGILSHVVLLKRLLFQ